MTKRYLLFVVCMGMLSSIYGQKLSFRRLKSPELLISEVKSIAVLDFCYHKAFAVTGKSYGQGRLLANNIMKYLNSPKRYVQDGVDISTVDMPTNFYTAIERTSIESVLNEMNVDPKQEIEDAKIFAIGEMLNTDLVIYGQDFYTVEQQTEDVSSEMKDVTIPRYSVSASANTQIYCKIYSMKENKVLAEINFSTNGAAGKSTDALSKVDKLKEGIYKAAVKEAYDKAAKNIVDYFAPSISSEIANFENVKDKSYKKKLKALLKGNELEQAYQIYQEIAAKDPAAVEPVYNMGLINEIVGNYETARDLYTVAFEKKSNKKYLKAKQDAEKTLEVIKTLNLQIPVYPLEKSQKKLTQTN